MAVPYVLPPTSQSTHVPSTSAVRRTFTLREFADLASLAADGSALAADGSPAQRWAALVRAAPQFRSRRTAGPDDDIADPYGRDEAAYVAALSQVEQAVVRLVGALGA